jgi:hypothetical protein
MVRLGKAFVPLDLMSYSPSDQLPSIFYLKQSSRQSIVAIFNWTEKSRSKSIRLTDLGLEATGQFTVTNVFDQTEVDSSSGSLSMVQPAHSVKVLKILDRRVGAEAPALVANCPRGGAAGENIAFSARTEDAHPALAFHWDFGDGAHQDGSHLTHAWTEPGDYSVDVTAVGLDNSHTEQTCKVHITGHLPTTFIPARNARYQRQ